MKRVNLNTLLSQGINRQTTRVYQEHPVPVKPARMLVLTLWSTSTSNDEGKYETEPAGW